MCVDASLSKIIFFVRFAVEPTVTLDVSASDLLTCIAGTSIRIPATIAGRPVPKVTWTFDGTAETEKKNELHKLPVDSEVSLKYIITKTFKEVESSSSESTSRHRKFCFLRSTPLTQPRSS